AAPQGPPVYVDLAYLPGSWSARTVDEEFFRRVRSLCYVVSGDDHLKEGVLRPLLDALLAGKHHWGLDIQVTLIPTFDSLVMHEWYQETHERQQELGITVLGSNSTVAMQDETFPACKVEF
ncbi:MAP1S protein, partial [Alaudala cheleensis]|nr:MAP1S protein [Alaudala cheleensis]